MNIFEIEIDHLHADPANVRLHPERNMDAIKASLARFGQQKPIVIDENDIVRAGNGTLAAAKTLGWKMIRAVRTELKGSDATAYAIADNRTAELAEWAETELAEILRALQSEDYDLNSIGFNNREIDSMLESLGSDLIDTSEWPDRAEPESHSIVLRYRDEDRESLLRFIGAEDDAILTNGHAGSKILDRIREIAAG